MKKIRLSILIPSYNYKKGIYKILDCLKEIDPNIKDCLEVIISDDSERKLIESDTIKILKKNFSYFSYIYNTKSLGGAKNWNKLISLAKGEYIWILHHDEYWNKEIDLIKTLLNIIEVSKPNIVFLPLVKEKFLKIKKKKITIFQENRFSKKMFNKFIKNPYLFIRINILGPPSVVIYKNCEIIYDDRLELLIDIDFYIRLIKFYNSSNIIFKRYKNFFLISSQDNKFSITNAIQKNINLIKNKEKFFLKEKFSYKYSNIELIYLIYSYVEFKIKSFLSSRLISVGDE